MAGLEDEGERALELLEDGLDELCEGNALVRLGVVDVFGEDGDGLCVRVGLELVTTFLEDEAELGVVGDDAVVDEGELCGGV